VGLGCYSTSHNTTTYGWISYCRSYFYRVVGTGQNLTAPTCGSYDVAVRLYVWKGDLYADINLRRCDSVRGC
jgi:hypothetical protein